MRSPIAGATGNTEFFLHAVAGAPATADNQMIDLIDAAVAEATAGP